MSKLNRTQIWSSGGGVQSAAIAALIVKGRIEPPSFALIVDTEREQSTTWRYMDEVISPALATVGVTLNKISKSSFAKVDVWSGQQGESILLPVFTNQNGQIGKLPGYCSNEWKKRVTQRWASSQGVASADFWLGISTDELQRVSHGSGAKWKNRYPLIEHRMNRRECLDLVRNMGWPEPPRSSCWMCPNHTAAEWRDIKDNKPEDWHRAIEFDRTMRMKDPHAYLHHDCVPLSEADLDERNGILFEHCGSGHCFV